MIAIHSQGEGRDLVLLPGWGMHRAMWGALPALLAQHARVHICELPGYGDNARDMPGFDALVDALSQASAEKIDVLGWSLGGMLALSWAQRYPQQVGRLILLGSTPSFIQREDWPQGAPATVLKEFTAALDADPDALMQNFLRGLAGGEARPGEILAQMQKLFGRFPPASQASLRRGLEWLRDIDLRSHLHEIEQAALLLHGEADVITSVEASRRMAQMLPHAQLHTLQQCGHALHLSHTAEAHASITHFLYD